LSSVTQGNLAYVESGQPFCVPMLQARVGGELYVHGSTASRAMSVLGSGALACVTVTVIDGLVLARSAFEHSANYRSVMLLGKFRILDSSKPSIDGLRGDDEQACARSVERSSPTQSQGTGSLVNSRDGNRGGVGQGSDRATGRRRHIRR